MKSFIINSNDAGQRVSKFIEKTVPALPQGLLYKSFRLKRIKLNKKRCQPQDRLSQGDLLELYINDEFFGEGRQDLVFLKVPDRYEDQNILLVDKKPGLVVHEDDDNTPDTLINRILHYLYNKGEYQPDAEQSFVPALCNRIDRNTGGIVIAAKNAQALRILNQKVKDRELTKLYLCLVHGVMQPKSGTLRDFLLKDSQRNQVRVFKNQVPGSKTIITSYRTLRTDGKTSLLEVDLKTGRTHQIRIHMKYIGFPLIGDYLYNPDMERPEQGQRLPPSGAVCLQAPVLFFHRCRYPLLPGWQRISGGAGGFCPAAPLKRRFMFYSYKITFFISKCNRFFET